MPKSRQTAPIENVIRWIRGQRVILDAGLAHYYGVTTKQLNQAVRRNLGRFPEDFAFQIEREELTNLRSQIVTSSLHGGRRYMPWAFTEHGVIMLASVLNSTIAVAVSVTIVRTFVRLREMALANGELAAKFSELERRVGDHDGAIEGLFDAIRQLLGPPQPETERKIGFHLGEKQGRYRVRNRKKKV